MPRAALETFFLNFPSSDPPMNVFDLAMPVVALRDV